MKIIQRIGLAVVGLMATMTMQAQETYQELEQLTVHQTEAKGRWSCRR